MYDIYTQPPDEMIVFIFDRELNLKGVLENFSSLVIERSLFGVGTFTMTADIAAAGAEHLQCGNIVSLGKSDSRAGIIGHRKIDEGETRTITVSGTTLKGIAATRIIVPPTETEVPGSYGWESIDTTQAENVLRHYFALQCVHPRDEKRKIPGVVMDDLHDPPRGPLTPWRAEHNERLEDVMEAIGKWTGYGWDVRLDIQNRQLVFVVIPLRDRTQGSGNSVIFSRDIENLGPYAYTENIQDHTNTVYIGGAGEHERQLVLTEYTDEAGQAVDESISGWDRREVWVSAGNINDPEKLIYEGLHKQNQRRKPVHSAEAEIYNHRPFLYGVDWDLGDKVTLLMISEGHEMRLDTQITSITEAYENGMMRVEPVFGDESPTFKQRLAKLENAK